MTNPTMSNLKGLPYGGAQYVVSQDLEKIVADFVTKCMNSRCLWDINIHQTFIKEYQGWIGTSHLNTVNGLDQFPIAAFSAGTTESFDKFYLKNRSRRLRYFKGEYMYHQVAGRQYFDQATFIEDSDLEIDDAVVISLPFADTGNEHKDMVDVLEKCDRLEIPVLIDCAYFGICAGINFDFNHSSITDITFSLSKTFPVPHMRIGMRLTRTDDDDTLLVYNKTQYINRLSAAVGLELIKQFGPDYIYSCYAESQKKLCQELEVIPSKCVIFGIDVCDSYPEYNRGGLSNRLSFAKYLDSTQLLK